MTDNLLEEQIDSPPPRTPLTYGQATRASAWRVRYERRAGTPQKRLAFEIVLEDDVLDSPPPLLSPVPGAPLKLPNFDVATVELRREPTQPRESPRRAIVERQTRSASTPQRVVDLRAAVVAPLPKRPDADQFPWLSRQLARLAS